MVDDSTFVTHHCFYILGIGCYWYELIATVLIWIAMVIGAYILVLVCVKSVKCYTDRQQLDYQLNGSVYEERRKEILDQARIAGLRREHLPKELQDLVTK